MPPTAYTAEMLDDIFNGLGGPCSLFDISIFEDHLKAIIEYEATETGERMIQQEAQTADDSDWLMAFQARGFRREIMKYRDQPKESNRLLRILRRLEARRISKIVLFDTGIESAVSLLISHSRCCVQRAALKLAQTWLYQYPEFKRDASFMQTAQDEAKNRADLESNMRLIQDFASTAQALNIDPTQSTSACENTGNSNEENDTSTVACCSTTDEQRSDSFSTANASSEAYRHSHGIAVESIFHGLGPLCADTLAGAGSPIDQTYSNPASVKELPNTDFLTPVCKQLNRRCGHSSAAIRCVEDFLSLVSSQLCLDERTMKLLTFDLKVYYDATVANIDAAASTRAATMTITACSAITQKHIRDKDIAIAKLHEQEQNQQISSAAFQCLLQDKTNLEQSLQKQREELDRATQLQEGLESDILMFGTLPLKRVIDEVCRLKEGTRSLYGLDSKAGVRTIQSLQDEAKSSTTKLVASQEQLAKLQTDHATLTAQLEHSQRTYAQLKKNTDSERVSINNKYYKDLETRVEERVQQERLKLMEAEAKAQQYDAVKSECSKLRDQIKNTMREMDRHKAATFELKMRYKELKEREEATQQGYDQICHDKHKAEIKAATSENDLNILRAELNSLKEALANIQVQKNDARRASERPEPNCSTIEILTNNEQLTEADRLDMIAQKWHSNLQLAETEQRKHEDALKDTEARISVASRQLEELGGSEVHCKGRSHSRASLTAALSPDGDSSGTASRPPRSRVSEQTSGRARTTQRVSFIPTIKLIIFRIH